MKKIILPLSILMVQSLMAKSSIEVHTCYGTPQKLIVEGRLYNEKSSSKKLKEDGFFTNIKHSFRYLFNDEKKEGKVELLINNENYSRESDDEGYFKFETAKSNSEFSNNQEVLLSLENNITASCQALIVDDSKKLGIISDFDDTVIISNVTNKLKLLNTILLKNYKQRQEVEGMAEWYKKLLSNQEPILFFVTGSPKQLQEPIEKFLAYHDFPKRVVITKKIHGDNSDALFDQMEYKYAKIKDLILLYPNVTWILVGDSGEKDPQVYKKIRRDYPKKIQSIYIRHVDNGKIEEVK